MHPIVGGLLPRKVPPTGLELPNGVVLPGDTEVGISSWVVHFNKRIFGEDASTYRPERYLQQPDEDSETFDRRLKAMDASDHTFGGGRRACIGRHIALLEIYKFVPSLIMAFDVSYLHLHLLDWFLICVDGACKS